MARTVAIITKRELAAPGQSYTSCGGQRGLWRVGVGPEFSELRTDRESGGLMQNRETLIQHKPSSFRPSNWNHKLHGSNVRRI